MGKKVAGFLKLQQQLLGKSTAILTTVEEIKDFTQVVNWELLHWLYLSLQGDGEHNSKSSACRVTSRKLLTSIWLLTDLFYW